MDVGQLRNNQNKLIMNSLFILLGCLLYLSFAQAKTHKTSSQETNSYDSHHKVLIHNFAFDPESLTVQKGDTVTWINMDFAPHNISINRKDESTTRLSPNMFTNKNFTMTISEAFDYLCGLHPSMVGKILIEK